MFSVAELQRLKKMLRKKILSFAVILAAIIFYGCGETNPILGTWRLDASDQSIYVQLGISAATSGQSLTVVFKEDEMLVDFGRGAETVKVAYTRNEASKVWSFCLNDSQNCFPAVFLDENKSRGSFPLYGIPLNFVRNVD